MKKWLVIVILLSLLTGCGATDTFETLGDVPHLNPGTPEMREVILKIPAEAVIAASDTVEGISLYECGGYTILLQTFSSGDMRSTIQTLTGFSPEKLTLMESVCGDHTRLDWVWTAGAEEGDMVCRGTLLDDGNYHYCLCAMAEANEAEQLSEQWNALFGSFCLET